MRTAFLVLAILLLPLRGGFGDAMAQRHAVAGAAAAVAVAMDPGMAHGADDPAALGHCATDDACAPDCQQTTCTSCQLCHSIALAAWPLAPSIAALPRAAPWFEPAAFASAAPAPGFKPPIS